MLEGAVYATERARDFVSGTSTVLSKARSIASGDAQFFSVAPKIDDLRFSLASDALYEKRDAMKKIVAQMCKGVDMHALFPDVVKNIHVASTELRKLIYLFVVHYAEDCPNEALLSISAFQKDLVDPSMHVRSLALRMLSSMQIPAIHPVVMVAVKKSATDSAMIVRKTAAIALWQMCWVSRRETDMTSVYEVLQLLLNDKVPDVVGAAVTSYEMICKHKVDLIHPVFRHLCEMLPDCEEWGQDAILRVLLRYSRGQFCDPNKPAGETSSSKANSSDDSGNDENGEATSSSSSGSSSDFYNRRRPKKNGGPDADEAPLDPDHQLLLTAAKPLLFSLSSSVVVGVCALYMHCAPPRYLDYCVKPLMRVLRSAKEGHGIILNTIHCLLEKRPDSFRPYIKEFYLLSQDSADVRALKHRIISRLATKENLMDLFQEYKSYARGVNEDNVAEAVRGLGLIVSRHPAFSALTMRVLTPLLSRDSPVIVTEAVAVLRLLVMQGKDSLSSARLVFKLMQDVSNEEITTPSAVATVLWLVGESLRFHPAMAAAAPDCFRVFVRRFASLQREVKQEVLTLGCKVWLLLDKETELAQRFRGMFFYALELARYDDDYLIRDQARLVERTSERDSEAFRVIKATLEAEKPLPCASDPYGNRIEYELGTLSNFFGAPVFSYEALPPWRSEAPNASLRRPPRATSDTALWVSSGGGDVSDSSSNHRARDGDRRQKRKKSLWSSSSSSEDSSESSAAEVDGTVQHTRRLHSDDSSAESDSERGTSDTASSSSETPVASLASQTTVNGAKVLAKPMTIKMVVKRPPVAPFEGAPK